MRRVKIPAKYEVLPGFAQALSDVLRANGKNPGVTITGNFVTLEEDNITDIRALLKTAALSKLRDTTSDDDITI